MDRKFIMIAFVAMWLAACGGAPMPADETSIALTSRAATFAYHKTSYAADQQADKTNAASTLTAYALTPSPTRTNTLVPSRTPTPLATLTPTLTPTATAITYVRQGTPVAQPEAVISAENIDHLVELARWGRGAIIDVQLSPGGDYMFVLTTQELIAYETRSQEELWKYVDTVGLTGMDVQPAGVLVALGTWDGRVVLVDRLEGGVIATPQLHRQKINSLAFSPDGKRIVSGSINSDLKVWNIEETAIEWEYVFEDESIEHIFFSGEGETLVIGLENSIEFLDAVKGTIIGSVPASNRGNQRYLSSNRRYVSDGITMWDAQSGETLYRINHEFEDFGTSAAIFSPDSTLFALSYKGEDSVEIRRVSDGELVHKLESPFSVNLSRSGGVLAAPSVMGGGPGPGGALSLAFSPDGKTLAANLDGITVIWDVRSGKLLKWFDDSGELLYSKGGDRLIIWLGDDVSQFGITNYEIVHTTTGFFAAWSLGTFITSDGRWFLVGSTAWDLRKGIRAFEFGNEQVIGISPDGDTIYLRKGKGSIVVRDVGEFKVIDEIIPPLPDGFSSHDYYWLSVPSISPTGEHLTNYVYENTDYGPYEISLFTYDVENEEIIKQLTINDGDYYTQAVYSPDGTMLVFVNYDNFKLYQIKPDIAPIRGERARGSHYEVAFSPDGSLLAITGYEKAIVYLVEKNVGYSEYFTWEQDDWSTLSSPVFSPDNQLFLFSDRDGNISVIDLTLGEKVAQFNSHFYAIDFLAFSPDGRYLVTDSEDGTIRLWGIAP